MRENKSFGFQTRSDTNRPGQSQKQARGLRFRHKEEEGLIYYPCAQLICVFFFSHTQNFGFVKFQFCHDASHTNPANTVFE